MLVATNSTELRAALIMWDTNATSAATTLGPLGNWNVALVADFEGLLTGLTTIDEDLSGWNTGSADTIRAVSRHAGC